MDPSSFSYYFWGEMVYNDVMLVHDPLEFNFLLGRDYVYALKSFVSTLFQVMCFSHNENIMTIEQLSFIGPNMMANNPPSLNVPYMTVEALESDNDAIRHPL